jgi:hypothetical protein
MKPLCFVLMPFGKKPGPGGVTIDFDAVYRLLIAPAVEAADLTVIRADEEKGGGIIHKPMFERLILCEYAVADLTAANANVFYELGLRHAVRRASTVLTFAEGMGQLPFDVAPLRALPYRLGADGTPLDVENARKAITERLNSARTQESDSPIFQLVENFPDIQRLKTDVFRDRVDYSDKTKARLAAARKQGRDALYQVESNLAGLRDEDAGVVIDLLLSYRAVEAWDDMVRITRLMSRPLAASVLVQEQLAFALNRAGESEEAERVLLEVIRSRGPSSETYGILGRVYKDRWESASKAGDKLRARGLLEQAISAYLSGFNADIRDAFPGINAVTLMELRDPPDPRRLDLLPAVSYAAKMRIAAGHPDYWDHATRLELAVLRRDEQDATAAAADALAVIREPWEPKSTARNLRLIREARARRGEALEWAEQIENELLKRAG